MKHSQQITDPARTTEGAGVRSYSKPSKVAGRLGVHKNTIFRWIRLGRLTPHKIGDTVLIANDEVDHLMSQARVATAA